MPVSTHLTDEEAMLVETVRAFIDRDVILGCVVLRYICTRNIVYALH